MEGEDLDRTLKMLCQEQAPVTVISVDSGGICRGRFQTLSEELITLDLPQQPDGVDFSPLSQCACLFRYGNGGCVFLAEVHSLDALSSPQILVVHRPQQAACEARRAFRVPIIKQLPEAELTNESGETFHANAVDLSMTGVLLEFPGEDVPDLPVGSRFKVHFRLEELNLTLMAEVRRRYGKRYGLFFSDVLAGDQLKPPAELSTLVHRLEQIWLDSKKPEPFE